jgi:hypothetical protein
MSVRGRWHAVEAPGYDMAFPSAYILAAIVETARSVGLDERRIQQAAA